MQQAADLFCGAGGTSTGLLNAAAELGRRINLVAINHWDLAIETHSANHVDVTHFNSDLEKIDPLTVVPGGKLRLLVASPECTHFSRARGGKPMSKQSRASVKYILRWVAVLDVQDVLIENVPDFETWGPLNRKTQRPIANRKGEYFHRFIRKMRELGYTVEWRVLNAADYGDPTTRKRLFIMARKGKAIHWPEASHHKNGGDMFGARPRWKAAREIIDWSVKGESIFKRKRPLAANTLRRISAGLMKYGGKAFILGQFLGNVPRDLGQPIPTVMSDGGMALVQPFIIPFFGERSDQNPRTHSVDEPLPSVTSHGAGALVQPFIMQMEHSTEESGDSRRVYPMERPLPTITQKGMYALVEPFVVMLNGTTDDSIQRSHRPVTEPLPTVTATPHLGLAQPFLVEYYGTGESASVDEPMRTLTGRDRFALVEPMVFEHEGKKYVLDILFRMLQPNELARAMSFPDGYKFSGTREQVVKQIGNAVPVELATALCKSLLENM